MPKYLLHGHYTIDGLKGVLKEGGTSRRNAIAKLIESAGGTLEFLLYAFGDDDYYIFANLPDNNAATAISLTINASGAGVNKVTVLITPEEVDEAVKKHPSYRPPGQ